MNLLSKEKSPYLLQHKDNPVNWFAWGDEAWEKAKLENKLVLVSIGYSSCHWCHVMEREVFEDHECAEIMNSHFVCIKVDREERPDVDSLYMDAVHLMGSKGGWPLNVFTLPDGRPVYGGTYFPKVHWISMLDNLSDLYRNDHEKVMTYAKRLHDGMTRLNIISPSGERAPVDHAFIDRVMEHWSQYWDLENGGSKGAPKFPMPVNIELLLQFGVSGNDQQFVQQALLTLEKMALGGICDQVGGGFCRYSVDDHWKVPHFEKMLYDNAQLASVFSKAYRLTRRALFRNAAEGIFNWVEREMKSNSGLLFSALDADSEGVEGKFYTWNEEDFQRVTGTDFIRASEYYRIGKQAYWEHDQNILLRNLDNESFASLHGISLTEMEMFVVHLNERLLDKRNERIRPGLDDKCITSWNAMMVSAYTEMFQATADQKYRLGALSLMRSITENLMHDDGTLWHVSTKEKSYISGFLDDYAFTIQALIDVYEITGDQLYLLKADELVGLVIKLFGNDVNDLFFFTHNADSEKLGRKQEVQDNVIPSSNSVMCKSLLRLAAHLGRDDYRRRSESMIGSILPQLDYAAGYGNWLQVCCLMLFPFHEVVICGPAAMEKLGEINRYYLPGVLFAASTTQSELPLFRERFHEQTAIYVCTDKTCHAPVFNIDDALQTLT